MPLWHARLGDARPLSFPFCPRVASLRPPGRSHALAGTASSRRLLPCAAPVSLRPSVAGRRRCDQWNARSSDSWGTGDSYARESGERRHALRNGFILRRPHVVKGRSRNYRTFCCFFATFCVCQVCWTGVRRGGMLRKCWCLLTLRRGCGDNESGMMECGGVQDSGRLSTGNDLWRIVRVGTAFAVCTSVDS